MDWQEKWEALKRRIADKGKLLVAYSGGVDSSLLAKAARDVLGKDALCIILDSVAMPRSELEYAEELAGSLQLNCKTAEFPLPKDEEFVENTARRCYFCRKASARLLKYIAAEQKIGCIADGVNLSDYQDFRPGIEAGDEEGIWHPFVEARMTKEDIRQVSRNLGLPFWNKPSSACLASRIPYGEEITPDKLEMVEEAEDHLRALGFFQLRVRAHGRMARIELPKEDIQRALGIREDITRKLKEIGFQYVTLDLEGFRSGSMNEVLWTMQP